MGIVLKKLVSCGPGKKDAEIVFDDQRTLIRGPSDTGKSYIRDCIWYCLGGDSLPKVFPEMEGYDLLRLEFLGGSNRYQIERGLAGGGAAVYRLGSAEGAARELLDEDEGQLLVRLSGAAGRLLLRSKSKKGPVTAGDLRHWSLISQPDMISQAPTSGVAHDKIQRIAAFNLFLTGNDDEAIQLTRSQAEVEQIKGKLASAEDALRRVQAGLQPSVTRKDLEDSFERVNATLAAMTRQYEARASSLKAVREQIARVGDEARKAVARQMHSASMVERFDLLDKKYASDLERLGATSEGVGFYEALPEVPCPLCGTPAEQQVDPAQLRPDAPRKYRVALAAEVAKISTLRTGLSASLEHERERFQSRWEKAEKLKRDLTALENSEAKVLSETRVEFSADPRTLAEKHSELSAQLGILDEIDRLAAEIEKLKLQKVRKRVPVSREGGANAKAVADLAKGFLHDWGFTDIYSTEIDTEECDLRINGRTRLSFGAGKRAIFLCALIVALLRHAMEKDHPHLGIAVIDSPLKAYADPTQKEDDVPAATVTENFYAWLASWTGPGQIVILENERISAAVAGTLRPIEFTRSNNHGRAGFYPLTITPPRV